MRYPNGTRFERRIFSSSLTGSKINIWLLGVRLKSIESRLSSRYRECPGGSRDWLNGSRVWHTESQIAVAKFCECHTIVHVSRACIVGSSIDARSSLVGIRSNTPSGIHCSWLTLYTYMVHVCDFRGHFAKRCGLNGPSELWTGIHRGHFAARWFRVFIVWNV